MGQKRMVESYRMDKKKIRNKVKIRFLMVGLGFLTFAYIPSLLFWRLCNHQSCMTVSAKHTADKRDIADIVTNVSNGGTVCRTRLKS
jgi:hypothetical protein